MFRSFLNDESGIVTTDWIVLTAAIGGICLGAVASIRVGVQALAFDIETSLSGAQVGPLGQLGFISYTPPSLLITEGALLGFFDQQRDLLSTYTESEIIEFATLHATDARNDLVCAGVRSCAVSIDNVALAVTELQARQASPAVVAEATALHTEQRARWP